MAVALAAHDAILRDAVEHARGTVVKTTGDGMLAAFDGPRAAVEASVAGQRALREHDWPTTPPLSVRMAIHAGSAETRDGDFFGPALNRVARLLAIGHGGQILVSSAGAAVLADDLPPDVELLDRGEHRLKDINRPERVYQLLAPGLPAEFPPLRSGAASSNLPAELTSFIGREREVAEICALLGTNRLVTLVGVGGTGKTRLLLRAAAEVAARHVDGAWLVELAPLSDPGLVLPEVARALGVRDIPGQPLLDVVTDFLRDKDLLLLIDNCEHLIGAAADAAERLLAACRSLRVLATSREAHGRSRRGDLPGPVAGCARNPRPHRSRGCRGHRGRPAVRGPRHRHAADLPARRVHRRAGGGDLPAPRRHPARTRARRREDQRADRGRDRPGPGRPLPSPDRRPPDLRAASADPAGAHRLELGPAGRAGPATCCAGSPSSSAAGRSTPPPR